MNEYSVASALRQAELPGAVSDTPQLDCQLLLAHTLGTSRAWLLAHREHMLTRQEYACFIGLVGRRTAGEPVAYMTGTRDFWKRSFKVSPATFIPRPETELLVETVLNQVSPQGCTLVDLGTGSGAIAISLAEERPGWQLTGVDDSLQALHIAQQNGQALPNLGWVAGSWGHCLRRGSVDIVVSNPPYLRADDRRHLGNLAFEPLTALVAGPSGLDAIRAIAVQGFDCLRPGGRLFLEHGYDQQPQVCRLLQQAGFSQLESLADMQHLDRVVTAVR